MANFLLIISLISLMLASCVTNQRYEYSTDDYAADTEATAEVNTIQSITIEKTNSLPVTGEAPIDNPTRVITFSQIGDKAELLNGESANIIYDGISPEDTYIKYESTYDGYIIELSEINRPTRIVFSRMCQKYIVASPTLVNLVVPTKLKYEQIVWTPREDGYWEVRIGSTQRGCTSEDLNKLMDMRRRNKDYEKNIPR